MKTNIKDLKELIVNQQLTIQSLQKKVDDLQDSYDRRQVWLSNAKREAGADTRKSFDDVWKEMLDKPTWDDIRKAIILARENNFGSDFQKWLKNSDEEIIEQLKQSKV